MFPLTLDGQNIRPPHYISNFSFPSLSLFIQEHPYQTSQKTSDPLLKTSFWRRPWIFFARMAGWYHQQWLNPWSKSSALWSCQVRPLGLLLKYSGTIYHSLPGSLVPTSEPRHSHLGCNAGHTPTTRVDGHVPPIQQPRVHMPAFLVMQRPHVTPTAWTRARSKREEDRRECSVPQTQICSPSLTHMRSVQEKPAKSKHCAKLSIVYLVAQFPKHTDCQSDGVGCSGGTLLQDQMLHPEPLVWSTRAEVTSLHSWGLPWTTVQPTEEHKSYRDIIKRKTLSEAMGS